VVAARIDMMITMAAIVSGTLATEVRALVPEMAGAVVRRSEISGRG